MGMVGVLRVVLESAARAERVGRRRSRSSHGTNGRALMCFRQAAGTDLERKSMAAAPT
jgi:hypothetical protein